MPLGTEIGLGSGDIVLDWDPALPPQEGDKACIFGPCPLWPNSRMDQDGTWHGAGPRSRPHCARWEPSSPPQKGGRVPPIFGPFVLWPNGWTDQDENWHADRPRPWPPCVRWGPSHPSQKGGSAPPQFLAHFYCGQTAACIKIHLVWRSASAQGTLC